MTTLRNLLIGAAGIAAAAAFATGAAAQNTANTSIDVNANVIRAIQISPGDSLEFGTIVTDSDGGSVVIAAAGGRTLTGLTGAAGTTPRPGTFHITAETGQSFGVVSAFDNTAPAAGLSLGSVTLSGCGATTATPTGNIATGTTCDLAVGGTLTVTGNATGVVATTLTTTVTYN